MKNKVAKVARIINCHDVLGKRSYERDILTAVSCGSNVKEIKNTHNHKVNFDNNKKERDNFAENR